MARVYLIDVQKMFGFDPDTEMVQSQLDKISGAVDTAMVRRGDLILMSDDITNRYRNRGILIWNGAALEPLDYTTNDYGSVPSTYIVSNECFSPLHWIGVIDGCSNWWPSDAIRAEAARNIVFDGTINGNDVQKSYHTTFTHKKRVWSLGSEAKTEEDFRQALAERPYSIWNRTSGPICWV